MGRVRACRKLLISRNGAERSMPFRDMLSGLHSAVHVSPRSPQANHAGLLTVRARADGRSVAADSRARRRGRKGARLSANIGGSEVVRLSACRGGEDATANARSLDIRYCRTWHARSGETLVACGMPRQRLCIA
jgi:hypothetical protein